MNALRGLMWGMAKIGLLVMVIGLGALALGKDSHRAAASHTEIFPSLSGTSALYAPSVILVKGGGSPGYGPCSPGDQDPTTACVYIWAKNVDNTSGASAFEVHASYPSNGLTVGVMLYQPAWLGSTNRSVGCLVGVTNQPGDMTIGCNTLLPPPPLGPNCPSHCTGLLASISLASRSTVGIYTLDFSNGTFLVDTPFNPDLRQAIPATVRSTTVAVAPCADFNGDHTVRVNDILYVVGKYFTSDPLADLNASGAVHIDDILIAIGEYFMDCTA